jgi:hypothetical protein
VHVQVMDNTGSTSFILFDRNVSNYVGKSVQDLIDAQGQVYLTWENMSYIIELGMCSPVIVNGYTM